MTLSNSIDLFCNEQLIRGNADYTIKSYKSHLAAFIKFTGNIDIKELSYDLYCKYIIYLRNSIKNLSTVTIHTYANSLKCFFTYLYQNNLIDTDISYNIKKLPKQIYKIPNIISIDVMRKIINDFDLRCEIDTRNALILVLAFDSGIRLSELIRLKIDDLDLNNKTIRVTGKNKKQRNIPLTDTIEFYLLNYLDFYKFKNTGPLLVNSRSEPIKRSAIISLFRRIKAKYNLKDFHPHLLRHSFATLFLKNGGDSLVLQDILGHSTLEMTRKYVHLANSIKMSEQKKYSPLSQEDKKRTSYPKVRSPCLISLSPHSKIKERKYNLEPVIGIEPTTY